MSMQLVERHFRSVSWYWRDVYQHHTVYGEIYRQRTAAVLEFADSLGLPSGASVADIGCGAGLISVALAARELLVDAVDLAPEMVRMTREAARAHGVLDRMTVRVGDVNRLDLPASGYDLVVAAGVLEWMPELDQPLARLAQLLRPGGHLIANVDNSRALHCLLDPRLSPLLGPIKRRLRKYLPAGARPSRCARAALDRALIDAGLVKVSGRTSGFGPFTLFGCGYLSEPAGLWLHHKLQALADRGVPALRHGGETYLVLARKS